MTIILYDIPSTLPDNVWNPNVWKTRFSLNFKGLPYTTQWIEYPDISTHCKKFSIPPTGKWPDGSPCYTLPAIHDPSTGVYISDSILIAEYLETAYPTTPTLFPNSTAGIQSAFNEGFLASIAPLRGLVFPDMLPHLGQKGIAYMRPRAELVASKNPAQDWIKLQEGFSQVDGWYARNGGEGLYLLGGVPSWSDIVVVSFLEYMRRAWGEESKEWGDVASWNGGRWKGLSDAFRKYETIDLKA